MTARDQTSSAVCAGWVELPDLGLGLILAKRIALCELEQTGKIEVTTQKSGAV
jgi:hypothetical protein